MGKYDPLCRYLLEYDLDEWHATFSDIEKVLGFPLPESARGYQAWWANQTTEQISQAKAWREAGWETADLNLSRQTVRFRRVHPPVKVHQAQVGSRSDLEAEFHEEMLRLYRIWRDECDYRATRFIQKVKRVGGLAAAKELLNKKGFSQGLVRLSKLGRAADSSVEATVLREPWTQLFNYQERSIAGDRLESISKASRQTEGFRVTKALTAYEFEELARLVFSGRYRTALAPRKVPGVAKTFDLVSEDCSIVGDAKYYTMVRGERLPPAKFSVIAEHVWLLEKTGSPRTFLVFGNDRRVPLLWLKKYGNLVQSVEFLFLTNDGIVESLNRQESEPHEPVNVGSGRELTVVTKGQELARAVSAFRSQLRDGAEIVQRTVGWPGPHGAIKDAEVIWRRKEGFWAFFRDTPTRYWNAFGITSGPPDGVLNIGVEINPPIEGVNRYVYGQIVRDGTGAFHLAHKGGLGGGRGGTVKTQKFWRLFRSPELELVKWSEDGRQVKMHIIGMIGGSELTSRLRYFIAEAERIKRLAKSGQLS